MVRQKRTRKTSEIDTSEFDKEFVADSFGAPPPAAKLHWERAKRRQSRMAEIQVALPADLLKKSDALAKKLGVSRDELVDRGLHAVLAAAGER